MIVITKNKLLFCCLILFLFKILGCSTNPNFERRNCNIKILKRANLGDLQCTGVKILQAFPNESICNNQNINANLYICENVENGDTLCVFDACNKVPDFAKENLNENFCILKENVKNNIPDSVSILVPKSFRIPLRSKFVFSTLTRLID